MTLQTVFQTKCFGGRQTIHSHASRITDCTMRFAVYLPPQAEHTSVPALLWLSGLTCTEENFITKAGAQRTAAELGMALIVPDTSPRGLNLPGEHESYDFGAGAGFYLDATQEPWAKHYRMYSYIVDELLPLVTTQCPIDSARISILGHSMGGHGALVLALRNPALFRSVSAFSPIASVMHSPWGIKALNVYLGSDQQTWQEYDAVHLIQTRGWKNSPILIDQGTQDAFLQTQLKPELLSSACAHAHIPLQLRMQEGYDHSYYFIASFIDQHLKFHATYLI